MVRIFSVLGILAVSLILLVGGGVYWFSKAQISQANEQARTSLAKGIAFNLSGHINVLNQMLDQMAENPDLIEAVKTTNQLAMKGIASKMQNYLPGAMIIRILIPDSATVDKVNVPNMGFADLDLVQETAQKHQPAVVQGADQHRHLAIARQIKDRGRVIGVILASLQYDFLKKNINALVPRQSLAILKQDKVVLHSSGDKSLTETSSAEEISIPGTNWIIQFWDNNQLNWSDLSIISAIILIPLLFAALAFLFGFRRITAMLREDMSSVVKVVKDLMTNKPLGNYPITLNEMRASISTLVQFKRVLEHEGGEFESNDEDMGLSSFFDESPPEPESQSEPEGMAFLNANDGIEVFETEPAETAFPDEVPPIPEPISVQEKPEEIEIQSIPQETITETSSNDIATMFRAYDIRGIANKNLTKDLVYDLGRAIASEANQQNCSTIVVARDGRTSSPVLADSLAKGIISTGLNVLDLGMVPTPVLYFVVQHSEGHSGVMVTGSHNPAEYNGFKIVIGGETLSGNKIQALKQRIDDKNFVTGDEGTIDQNNMFVNEYIGMLTDDIRIGRPMKVVVDCGNGVAGELGPTLLKTMGCEVIELYCEIDGNFPNHHPDPSNPENLQALIQAVQENGADLGIAFDGDGDRLGIVDTQGQIIWPDRQMMLFAKDVLDRKPGSEIIYDVKCSRHLEEQILKFGGRPMMWKTGHSLMKAKIKETGAKLAGEMSGHIFFNDRWFGFDDALYAAARMIEILSADNRDSHEVFAGYPDSINTPELKTPISDEEKFEFVSKMLQQANFAQGKITDIDGLRVDFPDGWGLVRASNTTPCLVLRFEADNQEALKRIQDQFKQLMLTIKPDLNLPF
jgi:phosphomannomutase/phosphoglucomutase